MRGTPIIERPERPGRRIIPAYAGNTSFEATFLPDPWDHPRVCGEHSPQAQNLIIAVGSSPHMRGTPLGLGYELARQWIIPAYAGNTRLHHASAQAVRDHPRICGEHDAAADAWVKAAGSSPHMRGTLKLKLPAFGNTRIIPAYAGNTRRNAPRIRQAWDHPRICGEHYMPPFDVGVAQGSSPHMRGTRTYVHKRFPQFGIIPAYAGNTAKYLYTACRDRDHPRICGEHRQR